VSGYPLAPHGVFWTLQGEGALIGEPMAFVRLAGCSVGCAECDTDYRVDRRVDVPALIEEIRVVIPPSFTWPWVWITGGEPTDHDLAPLIEACHAEHWRVAVATAGTRPFTIPVEWLSVSPHSGDLKQRYGHELKLVMGLNGLPWEAMETLARELSFPWRYIQPLWLGTAAQPSSVEACQAFVLAHPGWRLAVQAHKGWRLP